MSNEKLQRIRGFIIEDDEDDDDYDDENDDDDDEDDDDNNVDDDLMDMDKIKAIEDGVCAFRSYYTSEKTGK